MDQSWRKLPQLRNDRLIFTDTASVPGVGKIVPCLLCTDPFIMRPFIGEPDQICPECHKTYDECAVVVCWHCNVVICRLLPKVLDNGYTIQKRVVLHSDCCNICCPGLKESHIVEISEWERTIRPKKIILVQNTHLDLKRAVTRSHGP